MVYERLDALNSTMLDAVAGLNRTLSAGLREISGQILDLKEVVVDGNRMLMRVVQEEVRIRPSHHLRAP